LDPPGRRAAHSELSLGVVVAEAPPQP